MKKTMKKSMKWPLTACFATVLTLACGNAVAQGSGWSQAQVCTGWNNPMNFTTTGLGLFSGTYFEGKVGARQSTSPNAQQGQTGVSWSSTVINRSSMETYTNPDAGGNSAIFPSNKHLDRCWEIYSATDQVSGHPVNKDPNTGDQLPYVPTQYNTNDPTLTVQTNLTKSIRVGTGRGRSSGGNNSVALNYYINVRPENALLYLYYSCVIQNGNHGTTGDPSFMVRVMKQNDNGQWVQASPTRTNPPASGNNQCDTLAYFVTATPAPSGAVDLSPGSTSGWHGSTSYDGVLWKEWDKVVINLVPMMYTQVRVEVMVSGCNATVHYAYAYICGECRPAEITSSGCPAGMSTDVTTLTAPPGLRNYVWYRSEYGGSTPTGNTLTFSMSDDLPNSTAYYTFHRLTSEDGTSDTSFRYKAQAEDFSVEYRPNPAHQQGIPASEDSMCNKQVFKCRVKSAINPSLPYESDIYTIVQNIKPTMDVDTLSLCGGEVQLRNTSYVPGDNQNLILNIDSTIWSFYSNPSCGGDPDTVLYGESVSMQFEGSSLHGVKVRTNIHEDATTIPELSRPEHNACYSEATYPIRPLPNPVGGFRANPKVLCDDDPTTLRDTTAVSIYRVWRFRDAAEDSPMDLTDSVVQRGTDEAGRTYSRSFTHSVEPIEMTVRNGLFYLNPVDQSDTIWCENTMSDTVRVFLHPELLVVGDTVVCLGTKTDATVSAVGVDSCTFQWSTSPNSITGGIPPGNRLQVTPYADTSTYYVRVTSPQGCVAWDSIHAYLVRPRLSMLPADGKVCPGDEVTLTGTNAYYYTWSASPADPSLTGQDSLATIVVAPQQTTTYTLVGHGSNDCDATPLTANVTVYPYPVPTVELDPGIVDSENPTITLRDVSPYSVTSMWTFAAAEIVPGREVTHTFEEATGADSVYVTLTNANEIGCQTVYPFGIPVNLYTAWFPNIFTPGSEDENAAFRLYTINAYEYFHIYVYNRFGQLIFDSSDPSFEWDGTMADGTPCPQGTYTYICRFRKPGAYTLVKMYGSITLVR